ncbi:hypothetical protein PGT21_031133 [Puccinia graminis f. sp. tritici]|uniref:Uncharacterized protein n=1 Tax=Puccinia graminis f. sp. tritici TaxID=56615 RepID=A0A5B0QXU9_PUCGR|nr:hypothetical protein PGT21_031133 [Puccinia graminis f. sp. tritici]
MQYMASEINIGVPSGVCSSAEPLRLLDVKVTFHFIIICSTRVFATHIAAVVLGLLHLCSHSSRMSFHLTYSRFTKVCFTFVLTHLGGHFI